MTDRQDEAQSTIDEESPGAVSTDVSDQLTVDPILGRAYDPDGEGGQEAVAEAVGKAPAGFDLEAEDRVAAEDKRPGVPPPGKVSGGQIG